MPCDTNKDGRDISQRLLRRLVERSEVTTVSETFAALETNSDRVNLALDLLKENAVFPQFLVDGKSSELSVEYRQKGNQAFKRKLSVEALEFYTKSILFSPGSSENLALAYANRSAVLFENRLYEECIADINRALKSGYPEKLKAKIETRMEKAKSLKPAQFKVEFCTPAPNISKEFENSRIQCASSAIAIKNSPSQGRHVVATRDIDPGEILAVETPFCSFLVDDFYTNCHQCLKLCYNLVPCEWCTQALFCSEECENLALKYHAYECPILKSLKSLRMGKLELLPMRIALLVGDGVPNPVENDEVYRSDRYAEIHGLVSNTTSRTVADLFKRAVNAAVIYHLVENHSKFFILKSSNVRNVFKELVLLHMQTGPCNFHQITQPCFGGDLTDKEIGAGAFSFLSLFNHSCSPNVSRYCHQTTIVIVAIDSIKTDEQCYDNYGFHHAVMKRSDRQSQLRSQYFFDCRCVACEQDFPLYEYLPVLRGSVQLSQSDMKKLHKCDTREARRILNETLPKIKTLGAEKPNKNLAELQEVVKRCYSIFTTIKRPF
ncbi:SET and MYND domain-containing protein 4-like [Cylas formicarius]|uniref:SET and MYND domain-containing protein 4-like n=1 Tax=Cylas formicarius TaxID=197179 RepID=UPI002958D3B0|nr:SET and MYND domain-containing protein 4-like [Cylas formicarius]